MKTRSLLPLLLALGVLVGCNSDKAATPAGTTTVPGGSLNAGAQAITAAKSNLAQAKLFGSSSFQSTNRLMQALAPNAAWTTTSFADPGGQDCPTMDQPNTYLQGMSDSGCTISPFFDLENLMDVMCVMMNEVDVTDGIPDVLEQSTITVSAATATSCGVSEIAGASFTAAIAVTSDTTHYSRLVTFSINGDSRKLYIGKDGSEVRLSFAYNRPSDTNVYRGVYHTDGVITRFEMHGLNKDDNRGSVYRVLIDGEISPAEVKVVGSRNDDNSSYIRWGYTGVVDNSSEIAVDMFWDGPGLVQTCVDPGDDFSADGTSPSCGTSPEDYNAPVMSNFNTVMAAAVTHFSGLDEDTFFEGFGETDVVTFDGDANPIESTDIVQ